MRQDFMAGELTTGVLGYAETLAACNATQLTTAFPDGPTNGEPWHGYVEDVRSVSLFLNLQLNRLTSELRASLQPTRASEICLQHHRAYRDLTGALSGIDEEDAEASPGEGEWSVRTVLRHITGAELGFSLLIDWAVRRQSGEGEHPVTMPEEEMAPHYDAYETAGTWIELIERYRALHRRVIENLLPLTDEQLRAPNVWWEGYEVPVWFRMHRFDAHLREHTIQVYKTLAAIGRAPTEAERLARLLHQSLADLEIAMYMSHGSPTPGESLLASEFDEWRGKLHST